MIALAILVTLMWMSVADANRASTCSRWYHVPATKLSISCPSGHTVFVTKAIYGYWRDQAHADNCHYIDGDCTDDGMRVAISHCHGKTDCEIPVGASIVTLAFVAVLRWDRKCGPWHDRHDYMEVEYDCREVPAGSKIVASDCTHLSTLNEAPHEKLEGVLRPLQHTIELRCPLDQTIRVSEAFYGWWKDNRDQGCRFHAGDCKEESDVAYSCDGQNSCVVAVDRSSTSNSCRGFHLLTFQIDHHDYFQVDYQCLKEK